MKKIRRESAGQGYKRCMRCLDEEHTDIRLGKEHTDVDSIFYEAS